MVCITGAVPRQDFDRLNHQLGNQAGVDSVLGKKKNSSHAYAKCLKSRTVLQCPVHIILALVQEALLGVSLGRNFLQVPPQHNPWASLV